MRFVWLLALFLHLQIETTVPAPVSNTTQCESPKMKCKTGECISGESICDGINDCSNQEDEMNCTLSIKHGCRRGYSPCTTWSICIPNRFLCDGQRDCSDLSDELDCEAAPQSIYSCSASDSFICKTTKENDQIVCLPQNATCNGIKECPLGDDEENCEDFKGCDIQEHKCQHFCEDRPGSFVCRCEEGYKLESDGYSCKSENSSSSGYLLVSYGREIHQLPLADIHDNTNYTVVYRSERGKIRYLDYMRQNDEIFMMIMTPNSTQNLGELAVLRNDGRMQTLRENINGGFIISVDWIGKNVFFTQDFRSSTPGISVCTMDGIFCRRIVKGKPEGQMYYGLVAHPIRGLIFWIDCNKNVSQIMMSNMDGSDVRVLVEKKNSNKGPVGPIFFAIDHVKNDVYFIDDDRSMVEKINIDTKKRSLVSSHIHLFTSVTAFSNGLLYWSDWHDSTLKVQELAHNHSSPHVVHKFKRIPPLGIAINDSLHQTEPSSNPCKELDCPWLCIVVPKSDGITAKCVCPDGYTPSTDTCIPPPKEMEILQNYSHIGFELMSEYCKTGVACKNGGTCRELLNETRIVCDCKLPYDGLFCERIDPNMHAAMKEFKTQFTVLSLISIGVLILLIVGCGVLVKFAKRTPNSSPRSLIDEIATTAKDASLVNNLRNIFGKGQKQPSTVNFLNGETTRVEGLPTTFNNPSFEEASPDPSITSSAAASSSTIRIEHDFNSL